MTDSYLDDLRLTPAQRRVLVYLSEHSDPATRRRVSPREVARYLWPDSPGWQRRTRKYGTNDPGALGGTMPMNAAKILHRLHGLGLAYDDLGPANNYVSAWTITSGGQQWLRTHPEKESTP